MTNALIDLDSYLADRRQQREEQLRDAGTLTDALSTEDYYDLTGAMLAMLTSDEEPAYVLGAMRRRRRIYVHSILESEADRWKADYYEGGDN